MLVAELVDEGEVEVEVVDDDEVDFFEGFEVVPVEFAHLPHGLDGDGLVVGAVDLLHEVDYVADELQRPLHEVVVLLVHVAARGLVVVLHQLLDLEADAFQDVPGELDDQLLVAL